MKSKFKFITKKNKYFSLFLLFQRIKQAISKKDEQVQTLRTQFEAAVKRADHLEDLLAQQRKLIAAAPANGINGTKK